MKLLRIGHTRRVFTPRQLMKEILLGTSVGREILDVIHQYYSLRNGKTLNDKELISMLVEQYGINNLSSILPRKQTVIKNVSI